jgi:hypothetical protein
VNNKIFLKGVKQPLTVRNKQTADPEQLQWANCEKGGEETIEQDHGGYTKGV